MATNGTIAESPKLVLYTNHGCPYAHRVHITLKELGLEYEEVIIDLEKPREPWYLKINPRGLVPSIKYSNDTLHDEIVTESAIVVQFLTDTYQSHLIPLATSSPTAPLERARVAFIMDTWNSKVQPYLLKIARAVAEEEQEALAKEFLDTVEKEIDPLLENAAPFFAGSSELTLAEVNIAPFVLRFYALSNASLIPVSIAAGLDKLPNFSRWASAIRKHSSVTYIWNEEQFVTRARARYQRIRATVS